VIKLGAMRRAECTAGIGEAKNWYTSLVIEFGWKRSFGGIVVGGWIILKLTLKKLCGYL